jgi:SAM-dependent methyltransferase
VDDYRDLNRAMWDERAGAHAASVDYGFERYISDAEHLSDVVRFDLPRLGDIGGLSAVHLQCHIGTDTLSLHRLGATMSGLDFSGESLVQARRLAEAAGAAIDYRQGDVYDAAQILAPGSFDLVFTGIGALGWLPDISRWASVVAALLKPGGRFFIREGHPMMWAMADPRSDGVLAVEFPYFETTEPTEWDEQGTYVTTDHHFATTRSMEWNHGLGEIVQALLSAGIEITALVEHTSVPWEARPGEMTLGDDGEWRMTEHPERLPLTYTLQGVRR